MSWRRTASGVVNDVLDLVFPPACVSCGGLVESEPDGMDNHGFRHVCEGCRRRITLVRAPHCTTCGHPFFGVVAENIGCPHCETLQPRFREGRTATLLHGAVRDIVHALKYRKQRFVLHDIAAIVRANDYFREFLTDAILVPVPLHPRKRRERGFNQAELLADIFMDQAEGASVVKALRRVIDTPTQTRLDREQRQENLKNAFALATRQPLETGKRYVIVDDVFTTGATLNACAAVLRRAGLTAIDVATLGHG
jgi:ComF family protein